MKGGLAQFYGKKKSDKDADEGPNPKRKSDNDRDEEMPMPFKSKAQMKYLYAKEPAVAKKWASEGATGQGLLEHVKGAMNAKPPKMGHMARMALRKAKASRGSMVQMRKE
jgi:hypothetical protein